MSVQIDHRELKQLIDQLSESDESMLLATSALTPKALRRLASVNISWFMSQMEQAGEQSGPISVLSMRDLLPAVAAMGIGMFELGWKAYEFEQQKGEVVPEAKLND